MILTTKIKASAKAIINIISRKRVNIAFFERQTFSLEVKYTFYNKKARASSVNSDEQK